MHSDREWEEDTRYPPPTHRHVSVFMATVILSGNSTGEIHQPGVYLQFVNFDLITKRIEIFI